MFSLHTLKNTTRLAKPRKRVGRGLGSKLGKTCGRGEKGAGSRSGYKRRWGKEGGNMPLFMKIPIRGFNNARFRRAYDIVNIDQLNHAFKDGESVTIDSLREKGFISGPSHGVKLLGKGELKRNLKISVNALSEGARQKLTYAKIAFEVK